MVGGLPNRLFLTAVPFDAIPVWYKKDVWLLAGYYVVVNFTIQFNSSNSYIHTCMYIHGYSATLLVPWYTMVYHRTRVAMYVTYDGHTGNVVVGPKQVLN